VLVASIQDFYVVNIGEWEEMIVMTFSFSGPKKLEMKEEWSVKKRFWINSH